MKKNKLSLDKETLVRLQHQQLSAIEAGAVEGESSGSKVEVLAFASCCRKTCNGDEPTEPEVGV